MYSSGSDDCTAIFQLVCRCLKLVIEDDIFNHLLLLGTNKRILVLTEVLRRGIKGHLFSMGMCAFTSATECRQQLWGMEELMCIAVCKNAL